ncbi:hypothetical protein K435DRAFT_800527 [Dendrothele bispora CBS 962.96]|uniref:Uncharacterized protein n=1 Tax=Dendrothele bispora (strain CBS 962.96) TaxID=1314807 RepID=A0A4S8LSE3_DENBC|nr:hypothetical protein K435DRAFT_800527 [Dendrothele bispora CBS 962.96]
MPHEPIARNRAHTLTPYSRPCKASPLKSDNSAEDQSSLVTPKQLKERSQTLLAARYKPRPFLKGHPVSGRPYPISDIEAKMIYWSTEGRGYPELFTPREPEFLARYLILNEMYPAVNAHRRCKRTGHHHLISISSSGTLDIKCPDCNVTTLCNPILPEYQNTFDEHFAKWEKQWEDDRIRRESLEELFNMVDQDLI